MSGRNNPQRHREVNRARYLRRKKAGLCPSCGQQPAEPFILCAKCRHRQMLRSRVEYALRTGKV